MSEPVDTSPAFSAPPDDLAAAIAGIEDLYELYRDLIRAFAPPNVQFERERIIAQCAAPREWVFVLGLLSEGENECGLLLELMRAALASDPRAETAHLVDEAWYYLRTSIDETWQLDDGPPSAPAALAYLSAVLSERLATLRALPPPEALAAESAPGRAILLRGLRDERRAGSNGPT